MDTKNVLMAVIFSTLVLLGWAFFFEPPQIKETAETNITKKDTDLLSPSIEKIEKPKNVSRKKAVKNTKRIKIENGNIVGSISLSGALIDDITFKNYNKKLNSEEKVVFLNPKILKTGYYIETGWASNSNNALPNNDTIWHVVGNSVLTPNNPVYLEWNNNEGLIFFKKNTIG